MSKTNDKKDEVWLEPQNDPHWISNGINLMSVYPATTNFTDGKPNPANEKQLAWLAAWKSRSEKMNMPMNDHVKYIFPAKTYGHTEDEKLYCREGLTFQQVLWIEHPTIVKGQDLLNKITGKCSIRSNKLKNSSTSNESALYINARKKRNLDKSDTSVGHELNPPPVPTGGITPEHEESSFNVINLPFSNGLYTGDYGTYTRDRRGDGTFRWTKGPWKKSVYVGQYVDDLKNGRGRLTFENGDIYEGQFKDDQMNGEGVCTYKDTGNRYTGTFVRNERCGHGEMKFGNGDLYIGSWCPLHQYEKGTFTYQNGDIYTGEYYNSLQHGQGKLVDKHGEVIHDGQWVKDEPVYGAQLKRHRK